MTTGMRYRLGLGNEWADKAALDARIQLLKEGQAMPLQVKVGKSMAIIMDAIRDHGWDRIYLAFSGGRDSAVLAHLIQRVEHILREPRPRVAYMFEDTTLEDPSTYEYIRWWEDTFGRYVARTLPFKKPMAVIREHGYPLYSKRIAYMLQSNRRSKACGDYLRRIHLGHLLDTDIRISRECCFYLKHGPGEQWAKDRGQTAVLLGMRATDSRDRRRNWIARGCYYPVKKGADRVWPLSFWTEADVAAYHREVGLPWARLYDMGFTRNGCRICGFGCHLANPNKFQLLATHYPTFWEKAMTRFGYFDVCEKLGIRDGRK
ncbi:hypothetical protein LCGC14_1876530 [marine sediment metagenome]|uniref:Phosphoadenosine phosphosulphate reductase domain-containing protein n=1 Tax=marine sediment metagenome TaxID=412755 RepID=A0A0F9IHJ8_9ZZZZ